MKNFLFALVWVGFHFSFAAKAETTPKIYDVYVQGSGCRNGSTSTTLTPNSNGVSVLFSEFMVDSAEWVRQRSCLIRLKIKLPPKVRMSLKTADYRGFAYANGKDAGALFTRVLMTQSYQLQASPVRAFRFKHFDDEIFFQPKVNLNSNCGGVATVYFQSHLQIDHPWKSKGQSFAQMDSFDFSLPDHVTFKKCK